MDIPIFYSDYRYVGVSTKPGQVQSARWGQGPLKPQKNDTVEVGELRKRITSKEAKEIYKQRAATSERVNADVRTRRTLDRFLVRGLDKVLTVALLNAVTFNILRWISLRMLQ